MILKKYIVSPLLIATFLLHFFFSSYLSFSLIVLLSMAPEKVSAFAKIPAPLFIQTYGRADFLDLFYILPLALIAGLFFSLFSFSTAIVRDPKLKKTFWVTLLACFLVNTIIAVYPFALATYPALEFAAFLEMCPFPKDMWGGVNVCNDEVRHVVATIRVTIVTIMLCIEFFIFYGLLKLFTHRSWFNSFAFSLFFFLSPYFLLIGGLLILVGSVSYLSLFAQLYGFSFSFSLYDLGKSFPLIEFLTKTGFKTMEFLRGPRDFIYDFIFISCSALALSSFGFLPRIFQNLQRRKSLFQSTALVLFVNAFISICIFALAMHLSLQLVVPEATCHNPQRIIGRGILCRETVRASMSFLRVVVIEFILVLELLIAFRLIESLKGRRKSVGS